MFCALRSNIVILSVKGVARVRCEGRQVEEGLLRAADERRGSLLRTRVDPERLLPRRNRWEAADHHYIHLTRCY